MLASHPLHSGPSCITSTFLLLSVFGKEQMWLGCRRPSQEHLFFLLRKCDSVWLFRAVYSSQDSRCVWMVQNTFCHFHRLCSTITSLSLKINCWSYSCICLLYYLCQGTEREKFKYKGDRMEMEGIPILTKCGVLCFGKLLENIGYFLFQPNTKIQNNACCWKSWWEGPFQSCWGGFLSHPQQEGCDQAPESCRIT